MTLRTRMLVALLAMALLPTLVYTLFTLDQLNRSIDHWYRPGVARALEAGLQIGKGSLARLEAMLISQSEPMAHRWAGRFTQMSRTEWSHALLGTGIDFVQVYRPSGSGWKLIGEVTPPGVLAATSLDLASEVEAAAHSGAPLRSRKGALAAVAPAAGGDLVVVGVRLHPDFFDQVQSLGQGAVYYRQLGTYVVTLQRRVYVLLVAGIVLLVAVAAWFLSARIARETARPIGLLSEAFGKVAAGDLTTRVPPEGAAELRSLGSSFNEMTRRLETAREAVLEAEREAAWRDVARKLAHEFRNILTPLRLSLQLVDAQAQDLPATERDAMRRSLASALREVDHLGRLAEQFSQYARLPDPHLEPIDLGDVVRAVLEASGGALGPVACRFDSTGPVRGDRLLLGRAVHNLALNAREASPPEAALEFELREDDGIVVLSILDRGSGFPSDLHTRLFEPYVSTKHRGSGLGLSLVRDIVRQHGGTVALDPRTGGGTRAEVALPRASIDPVAREREGA